MAKWGIYHKIEQKNKRQFLKRLSIEEGFRVLKGLYHFVYNMNSKPNIKELDKAKLKLLADVHAMYGKVKT